MTNENTTIQTTTVIAAMESYTFLKRVSEFIGRERITELNALPGQSFLRYEETLAYVSHFARMCYQQQLTEDGIPIIYREACYGIRWSVETGRLDGATVIAIKAMSVTSLIQLVHDVEMHCAVHAEVPAYLMSLGL